MNVGSVFNDLLSFFSTAGSSETSSTPALNTSALDTSDILSGIASAQVADGTTLTDSVPAAPSSAAAAAPAVLAAVAPVVQVAAQVLAAPAAAGERTTVTAPVPAAVLVAAPAGPSMAQALSLGGSYETVGAPDFSRSSIMQAAGQAEAPAPKAKFVAPKDRDDVKSNESPVRKRVFRAGFAQKNKIEKGGAVVVPEPHSTEDRLRPKWVKAQVQEMFTALSQLPKKQNFIPCEMTMTTSLELTSKEDGIGIGIFKIMPHVPIEAVRAYGMRVVIVGDSSGSMSFNGGILALREACKELALNLTENDQLAVIGWDHEVRPFHYLSYMNGQNKAEFLDKADAFIATEDGGTQIITAVEVALQLTRLANEREQKPTIILALSDGGNSTDITEGLMSEIEQFHRECGLDTNMVTIPAIGLGDAVKPKQLTVLAHQFRSKFIQAQNADLARIFVEECNKIQTDVFRPTSLTFRTRDNVEILTIATSGDVTTTRNGGETIWTVEMAAIPNGMDRTLPLKFKGRGTITMSCEGINILSGEVLKFEETFDVQVPFIKRVNRFGEYLDYHELLDQVNSGFKDRSLIKVKAALRAGLQALSPENYPWMSALVELGNVIDDDKSIPERTAIEELERLRTKKEAEKDILLSLLQMQKAFEKEYPWITNILKPLDELLANEDAQYKQLVKAIRFLKRDISAELKRNIFNYCCRTAEKFPWLYESLKEGIEAAKALVPNASAAARGRHRGRAPTPQMDMTKLDSIITKIDHRILEGSIQSRYETLRKKFKDILDLEIAKILTQLLENFQKELAAKEGDLWAKEIPLALMKARKCKIDRADYSLSTRAISDAVKDLEPLGALFRGTNTMASEYFLSFTGAGFVAEDYSRLIQDYTRITSKPAEIINSYIGKYAVVRPCTVSNEHIAVSQVKRAKDGKYYVVHNLFKVAGDGSVMVDNGDAINKNEKYKSIEQLIDVTGKITEMQDAEADKAFALQQATVNETDYFKNASFANWADIGTGAVPDEPEEAGPQVPGQVPKRRYVRRSAVGSRR